jgi:uncharacterized damage-inducible protein DinB
MITQHLSRLFEHMAWADRRVLTAIRASPEAVEPAVAGLFSHVLAAERVWLLRLNGEDSSLQPVWPELSPAGMESLAQANAAAFRDLLARSEPRDLGASVSYANTRGIEFHTQVIDILTHVALHGSYHRGQIALRIREQGGEPMETDYIAFARSNPPGALAPDPGPR